MGKHEEGYLCAGGWLLRQQTDAGNSCASAVRQRWHWNHLPEHEWTKITDTLRNVLNIIIT